MLKGSEYPSIRALRTFVAVSNYLSFSKAADALCITQSAVSKQIASLEQLVGLPLIQRRASGIELTEEGKRYLPQVTEALELIQHATANLIQSDSKQELLTVDVTPSFASLWLIPNIDDFHQQHPNIRVRVCTGDGNVKDSSNESDLHIRCLPLSTHYEYSHLLCEETLLLVGCTNAPAIESVHADSNYPFIPQITRPQLWEQFKTVYTVESPVTYQPVGVEHFYLACEAVRMGKGLALLPDFMAQYSILRGDIQHVLNLSLQSGYGYYVMIPNYRLSAKKVVAFHEWLKSKLS
ncbi:LysR family transcriptional regulator [Vibrio alginolyticus]|uniref:LysR family transcriptional regulator n=1 Tax=Vibrio alginolyticus TaxID=663 RepID=UPI0007207A4E|nr:LysR family transcriptional regulator [Vibrio alginolyticus]ALR93415.1 LysR family transcriptional regulator [Vibrio alginolyticus]MBY7707214.1 LysR family transcriptional regulator [Vibrio alginolyticus]